MVPNLIGNKPNWSMLRTQLNRIDRDDIIIIEDSADTLLKHYNRCINN
jgi:hypothetical protein